MDFHAMSYEWSVVVRVAILLAGTAAFVGLIALFTHMMVFRNGFGKLVGWAGAIAIVVAFAVVAVVGKDAERARIEEGRCKCQTPAPKGK